MRISGRPSLSQIGVFLYIGGQTRYRRSGFEAQESTTHLKNSDKMGSTLCEMLTAVEEESHKKLVMQLKTQTLEEGWTARIDCGKIDNFVQMITWALVIKGRSRQFVGFILFRTLESPIRVKTFGTSTETTDDDIDIAKILIAFC